MESWTRCSSQSLVTTAVVAVEVNPNARPSAIWRSWSADCFAALERQGVLVRELHGNIRRFVRLVKKRVLLDGLRRSGM